MNRTEKEIEIKSLQERFSTMKSAILEDYRGLTVSQFTDLRQKLKSAGGSIKVIKNRLAKRALNALSISDLDEYLKGPVAVADSEKDPVAVAKALTDFAKDNEKFEIKVGYMDGQVLTLQKIRQLAALPSREVLFGKMLGSLSAPATNLVNVLSAIPRQLVTVVAAIRDTKGE